MYYIQALLLKKEQQGFLFLRQKTFDIKYSFLSNFPEQNNIWICYIIKVGKNLQCIFMETFADLISSPTPVLVDVFAEWCAPCKIMAGILKKVKETQGDSLRIIKIDIDKNMNIAQHYAISSVPTLMIFKNGKQLWRQSGVIEANELNKIVEMFK